MRIRTLVNTVSVGVVLFGTIGTFKLCQVLVERERTQLRSRARFEAEQIAAQIRLGVLNRLGQMEKLGEWWLSQGKPLEKEEWQSDARLFLSGDAGLKQAMWLDGRAIQRWSIRPGALPDTKSVAAPRYISRLATQAHTRRDLVLSSLEDLPDGSPAFYACVPVTSGGSIRGYVVGLYSAAELLNSVLSEQLPQDFQVSLSAAGRILYAQSEAGSDDECPDCGRRVDVAVGNAAWTAFVSPSAHDIVVLRRLLLAVGLSMTGLLYLSAVTGQLSLRRATQLERMNAALEASEARFRRLIESDVIGIVVSNAMRITEANQFFLDSLGYSRADLQQSRIDWREITPEQYRAGDEHRVAELLSTGKLAAFEKELVRKDERHVPVLMGGALIEPGAEWKWICFVVDLTERKDLEQRLARAEKLKSLGMMAAGISHDFNNVLTSILGNTSFALEQLPDGHEMRPFLSSAVDSAHRAADLISLILAYTGRAFHTFGRIDLAGVLRDINEDIRHAAPAAQVRMTLEENLPLIRADEAEIRRVIRHLVANSAESLAGKPGTIQLSAGLSLLTAERIGAEFPDQNLSPGRYVRLEVLDDGCGMNPEIITKIFDPFFTTKFTGRGLGLSAVQGIVKAHRGGIRVESSMQTGTRFELLFPAEPGECPANRQERLSRPNGPPGVDPPPLYM